MEDLNISVFGTALGLAFIMVGLGITYAYRRILPYGKDPASQPHQPPEMVIGIFMNFMRGAWACLAVGGVLIIAANVMGPGLGLEASGITVPISLYYAAALGLLLVLLTYNVLHHRVKAAITSTDEDNAKGDQIARVHGNFTEYVPTGLALLIALEWSGAPALMVHFGGAVFTVARYLHAWGYTTNPYASFGRIVGIQSTLLALSYMVVASAYYLFVA
ncbi:MAG: MAPEG family protein [Alphaproteobacteria bacterium]